jgi:hypothetical protein
MPDEFRYHYREDRVLLNYRLFLPDEKPGQAVYLTFPELNMLRNMCEYLDRRSTWVYKYFDTFYDAPDDTDWDMIQGLVAELEEKLMPNQITPWGFTDRLAEEIIKVSADAGVNGLVHSTVPNGEVWVVEAHGAVNLATPTVCNLSGAFGGTPVTPYSHGILSPGLWSFSPAIRLVMVAGDVLTAVFYGCTAGDYLISGLYGYKMNIPG